MTVSRQPQINEELLSAYLDEQVTEEERALVEAAIATDPAIAWQVDSLRQTIHLLQELPPLALPRSFTLEAILAEARTAETPTVAQPEVIAPSNNAPKRTIVTRPDVEEPPNNWWQWLFDLWQGGNLQLRNAAAVALTLFFVLFAGDQFIVSMRPLVERNADTAPVVMTSAERAPAEAPVIATIAAEPSATFTPQPTATSLPPEGSAVTATTAPEAATAADTAQGTANPNAARTLDTQSPPFAAERSAPGPVEEDFTGGGGPGSDARNGGADALTQESYSAKEGGDQGSVAQLAAPSAAMNSVTEPQVLTATTLVTTVPTTALTTTTSIATLVTTTVTTTDVITTEAVTTTVATTSPIVSARKPSVVAPTVVGGRADWLTWAQVISAFSTVVLASLWWRSRR